MNPIYLITGVAAVVAIIIAYVLLTSDRRLKYRLDSQFGKIPDKERPYKSGYWKEKLGGGDAGHHIDDITWDDLDMDKVFSRIDACQSSVGEECLYAMLREPLFDADQLAERERLISLVSRDLILRLDLQVYLYKLGRSAGTLSSFLYNISSRKSSHPNIYKILALMPLLCAGVLILSIPVGAALTAVSAVTNGIVYFITKGRIEREICCIRYFSALLWCAGKITKSGALEGYAAGSKIKKGYETFKKLGGRLSGIAQERVSDLDFMADYFRIMFLSDIRNYNRCIDVLENNMEDFRTLFAGVGEVDAAIAISSFRASLPLFTYPEFTQTGSITAQDIYHPLLTKSVLNSAQLSYTLVSGSNASGKSTFIKAAAVNGILAQTIHTCTARRFITPFALVMSSMAVRDDITQGESYFIKEIKSLRRIIRKLPEVFCACYIDEILKGTNTIERIAASASVLRHIRNTDCVCVVATHDIELTRMLPGYVNYHFGESITESGVEFDYTIKEGPSKTKNAIKLLAHMEFDADIISGADALVKKFEETQVWDVLD